MRAVTVKRETVYDTKFSLSVWQKGSVNLQIEFVTLNGGGGGGGLNCIGPINSSFKRL